MHSVWDWALFTTRIQRDFHNDLNAYAKYLVDKLKYEWKDDAEEWKYCKNDQNDPEKVQSCPQEWIKATNQVNCDYVWVGYKRRKELGMGMHLFLMESILCF
jgi:hypothetical protein